MWFYMKIEFILKQKIIFILKTLLVFACLSISFVMFCHFKEQDIENKRWLYNQFFDQYHLDAADAKAYGNLQKTLFRQLDSYSQDIDDLSSLYFYLIVASIVYLLFHYGKLSDYEIPVIGVKIPKKWTFLMFPFIFSYLIINIGFLATKLIHIRVGMWRIIEIIEDQYLVDNDILLGRVSMKNLSLDFFFFDAWFLTFEPNFTLAFSPSPLLINGLLVVIALLFGFAQGVYYVSIFQAIFLKEIYKLQKYIMAVFGFITISLVLMAHFSFYFNGPNFNWFQMILLISSVVPLIFMKNVTV